MWSYALGAQEMVKCEVEYPTHFRLSSHLRLNHGTNRVHAWVAARAAAPTFCGLYEGYLSLRLAMHRSSTFSNRTVEALVQAERAELLASAQGAGVPAGWKTAPRRIGVWLLVASADACLDARALLDGFSTAFSGCVDEKQPPLASTVRASIACGADATSVLRELDLPKSYDAAQLVVVWYRSDGAPMRACFGLGDSLVKRRGGQLEWSDAEDPARPPRVLRSVAELVQAMLIEASSRFGAPFDDAIMSPVKAVRRDAFRLDLAETTEEFRALMMCEPRSVYSMAWSEHVAPNLLAEGHAPVLQFAYNVRLTPWATLMRKAAETYGVSDPSDTRELDSRNERRTMSHFETDAFPGIAVVAPGCKEAALRYALEGWTLRPLRGVQEERMCLHYVTMRSFPKDVRQLVSLYGPGGRAGERIGDGVLFVTQTHGFPMSDALCGDINGWCIQACDVRTFEPTVPVCIRGRNAGMAQLDAYRETYARGGIKAGLLSDGRALDNPAQMASFFSDAEFAGMSEYGTHMDDEVPVGGGKHLTQDSAEGLLDRAVASALGMGLNERRTTVGEAVVAARESRVAGAPVGDGVERLLNAMLQNSGASSSMNDALGACSALLDAFFVHGMNTDEVERLRRHKRLAEWLRDREPGEV